MAPLSQAEEDALSAHVLQRLSQTGTYACSSLTQLTSGTTNFVYRGILEKPLPKNASTTIIVKHFTDFVAINRDMPLDLNRCVIDGNL